MPHHLQLAAISEYIRSLGGFAPAFMLGLFVVQGIVPILPFALLVTVAAVLFGGPLGFLVSLCGGLLGSLFCYLAGSRIGGTWLGNAFSERWEYIKRQVNSEIAFGGIVAAHLVQIVPNAVINLTAVAGRVPLNSFMAATAMGLIPAILAYTGLGVVVFHIHNLHQILIILVLAGLILYLGRHALRKIPFISRAMPTNKFSSEPVD